MAAVIFMTCIFLSIIAGPSAFAGQVTVFAAASLKTVLDEIATEYIQDTGNTLILSLAGSSLMARQIQQGAPADVFISASRLWMDELERQGLIDEDSRTDIAGNRLVLIGHGDDHEPLKMTKGMNLSKRLGPDGRLAMALVRAVPAGIYGKAALEHLGEWGAVADRVAQSDNVRSALALVATGEATMGIVYATDARVEGKVSLLGVFPDESHPPVVYPAATIAESDSPFKQGFLDYLLKPSTRAIFRKHGFIVAGPPAS